MAVFSKAAVGAWSRCLRRLSAWALLGPMLVLSTLHVSGLLTIQLPRWLLAAAYALLGWNIGLGFRRETLLHAAHALLPVIAPPQLPKALLSVAMRMSTSRGLTP